MRPGDAGDDAGRMPRRDRSRALPAGDTPIDLDAVRADDDLVEALAAGLVPPPTRRPESDDVDGQLVALLASWVADVRPETLLHRLGDAPAEARLAPADEPAAAVTAVLPTVASVRAQAGDPGAVDPVPLGGCAEQVAGPSVAGHHAAVAGAISDASEQAPTEAFPLVVAEGRHGASGWWRPRRVVRRLVVRRLAIQRLAAAALLIVLIGSGLTLGAWQAKPGTTLWPMTRVVFAEKARSVQAATNVTTSLACARIALTAHQPYEAVAAYQAALTQLLAVAPAEGRAALAQESNQLGRQLALAAPAASTGSSTGDAAAAGTDQHVLASGSAGAAIDIASAPAAPAGNSPVLAAGGTTARTAATGPADDAPFGAIVAALATAGPATNPVAAGSPAGGGAGAAAAEGGAATIGGNPAGAPSSGAVTGTDGGTGGGSDGGVGTGTGDTGRGSSPTAAPPTDYTVVAPTTSPVDPTTDAPPPTSSVPSSTDLRPTDSPADSSDNLPVDGTAPTRSTSSDGGSTDATDATARSEITPSADTSA